MKVRHVDLHADELLAVLSGEMTPAEFGVYWMICLLCLSRGEDVENDPEWLRRKFRAHKGNFVVGEIVATLISTGKLTQDGNRIGTGWVQDEYRMALGRVEDRTRSNGKSSDHNGLQAVPYNTNNTIPNISSSKPALRVVSKFEDFWLECPRKVGKAAAEKAYVKALRHVSHADLIAGMRIYAAARAGKDQQFTVHPATWLNQGRWADESNIPPPAADPHYLPGPTEPPPSMTDPAKRAAWYQERGLANHG